MKKIIRGKRYDTETAKEVGYDSYGEPGSFQFWGESLYRKSTGEFFLYGYGGSMTKYARQTGENNWSGGDKIIPLSIEAAQEWAEIHMDADDYEKVFGPVPEDAKKVVNFSLAESVIEKIKRKSAEQKVPMSEYITKLVEADWNGFITGMADDDDE